MALTMNINLKKVEKDSTLMRLYAEKYEPDRYAFRLKV